MLTIYKKELMSFYSGVMGYLIGAFILLFAGLYMYVINFLNGYAEFTYVMSNLSFIFLIVTPILTMRSIAEERKQKTDLLLYSLPLGLPRVILGKFLAMLTVLAIPVGILCFYPLLLSFFGTVNFAACYTMIFAFLLLGASLIAMGLFVSSLTENQVIAAVVTLILVLLNYYLADLASYLGSSAAMSFFLLSLLSTVAALIIWFFSKSGAVSILFFLVCEAVCGLIWILSADTMAGLFAAIVTALSVFDRFNVFTSEIFDLTAVIYLLTVTAVFLFLTLQSMEKRRWS